MGVGVAGLQAIATARRLGAIVEAFDIRPAGSVIVDLAAEQGGNCADTEAGKSIDRHQVTIVGTINLPATVPVHASQLYAKNINTLLQHLMKYGALSLDFTDDIISSTCVTHQGEICHERVRNFVESTAQTPVAN